MHSGGSARPERRPRSAGAILREGVSGARGWIPGPTGPAPIRPSWTGPAPVRPSWGRRLLGVILLLGTVWLMSCQAFLASLSPGLFR